MSEKPRFLIVSADVLPEVILKVLEAKRLLSKAQAKNSSEACRMVGISRSAYYKYKDNVQLYEERDNSQLGTLYLKLSDEPGVLSRIWAGVQDLAGDFADKEEPYWEKFRRGRLLPQVH